MSDDNFDLVIIGGGINGAGIAADAAARGLKVLLAEAYDLGGATSSASSKLIHGGLRYLEHYEFRLVREALAEREVLLAKAPHIVRPMRFVLPDVGAGRPRWMVRAGLFLYDNLARRQTLGRSEAIDLSRDRSGKPLKADLARGYAYWDCAVDDSRLVIINAIAAREAGAQILARTPVTSLEARDGNWVVGLEGRRSVTARAVVNASGPWVSDVARLASRSNSPSLPAVRLVKGSHIVIPRIAGAEDAYTFQNSDGRVVFAIPYEGRFTMIGTTEQAELGDPRLAATTEDEERYLIDAANRFFRDAIRKSEIVWTFAGVRPLDDDGNASASAVSRDYRFELLTEPAPVLHVIGGKITTYRRLAEAALDRLAPVFPTMPRGQTAATPLPGAETGGMPFATWASEFVQRHAGFSVGYLKTLLRRYGTRVEGVIDGARSEEDMGEDVGGSLRRREIAYLKTNEWAAVADDVIWRRTKAALHVAPEARSRLSDDVQRILDQS